MKLLLDLSLASSLALYNTPYPKQLTFFPDLKIELRPLPWLYFSQEDQARCLPDNFHLWNPIVGRWTVEGGVHLGPVTFAIGHQSEHGIDRVYSATESFDYAVIRLHLETN